MRATFEKVPDRPDMSWYCYVRRAERFPFGWHYHDEAELTLILSGAGQRFVGDSIERYEAGDFVLIGPNVPHSWRSDHENGEQAAVVCQFRPDFLGAGLLTAPEFAGVRRMLDAAAAGVSFGADADAEARRVRNLGSLDGADRTLELMAVLHGLTRRGRSALSLSLQLNSTDAVSRKRLEAVIAYIDRTYTGEVTLQGAASVGWHPAMYGMFWIYRFPDDTVPDVVYSEGLTGAYHLNKPEETGMYIEALDRMVAQAADPDESVSILR
jgi:hypothetical protein